MYSRVTLLDIDTLRVEIDDVLERYETEILPAVRELPGYEGVTVMVTPEGKGMVVTFWDSEECRDGERRPGGDCGRGVRDGLPLTRGP